MAIKSPSLLLVFILLLSGACKPVQHISKTEVRYETISAKSDAIPDAEITAMIAPYKASLDEQMNEVIGQVGEEMTKKKPESTLGNWYVDAMMAGAQKAGYPADLGMSNYGGLRIPSITAGPLTRGEIYELCPFDNLLVIVEVPGKQLDTLMQMIAASEGWPVSSGVRMTIKNKVMTSCTIHGALIDPDKTYIVALPDYVANGGDGTKMLIPLTRHQTGIVVRDILIDEAKAAAAKGMPIQSPIEGRIVNQ